MILIRTFSAVIIFAALIILRQLVMSRDGTLRKILIAFFADEIWTWGVLLYAAIKYRFINLLISYVLIILIPKLIIKILFILYLTPKNRVKNLYEKE